jgi:hypothetical protein
MENTHINKEKTKRCQRVTSWTLETPGYRLLVTDEPVEVQNFKKITDHLRRIYGTHPHQLRSNRKISTCNRLDLGSTRMSDRLIMPKNCPGHWPQVQLSSSRNLTTILQAHLATLSSSALMMVPPPFPPYRASGHKSRNLLELDVLIPPRNEHPYAHVTLFVPLLVGVRQKR